VRAGPSIAAVCLVALAACTNPERAGTAPAAPLRAAVQFGELDVDGQVRRYRVFAPPSIEEGAPAPLVLALHDAFGSAEKFHETTQLDQAAAAGNFVVAYPEAVGATWNGGFCCGTARAAAENIDDLGFLARVLDELGATYLIDSDRVFAVGASNGAIMAYRLACELPDRITGVAAVGGAMVMDGCAPERPVSILAIHGTEDGQVPYEGGPTSGAPDPVPSQPALIGAWAELNDCANAPQAETVELVNTSTWTDCAEGTSVSLLTVRGGGHTWFSEEFDGAAGAVDATQVIADFFGLTPP
jgi:polyhydroxybutyrate depolymerase